MRNLFRILLQYSLWIMLFLSIVYVTANNLVVGEFA